MNHPCANSYGDACGWRPCPRGPTLAVALVCSAVRARSFFLPLRASSGTSKKQTSSTARNPWKATRFCCCWRLLCHSTIACPLQTQPDWWTLRNTTRTKGWRNKPSALGAPSTKQRIRLKQRSRKAWQEAKSGVFFSFLMENHAFMSAACEVKCCKTVLCSKEAEKYVIPKMENKMLSS